MMLTFENAFTIPVLCRADRDTSTLRSVWQAEWQGLRMTARKERAHDDSARNNMAADDTATVVGRERRNVRSRLVSPACIINVSAASSL